LEIIPIASKVSDNKLIEIGTESFNVGPVTKHVRNTKLQSFKINNFKKEKKITIDTDGHMSVSITNVAKK
jgi:hypothetical protein